MRTTDDGVVIYELGEDLPYDTYWRLIVAVGDWFDESRQMAKSTEVAKYVIDCCLAGVTPQDGTTPWRAAADAPLAVRIRYACRYDMTRMEPIRTFLERRS